jgi:hypothetical protein
VILKAVYYLSYKTEVFTESLPELAENEQISTEKPGIADS